MAIITRPPEDAAELAAAISASGGEPVMSPVIAIRHGEENIDLTNIGALAFTSANGVRAFVAQSNRRNLPIYAVGPITADIARSAGFTDIQTAESDVESLTKLVLRNPPPTGQILHITGQDSAGDLVGALTSAGVNARCRVGYTAEPVLALSVPAIETLRDPTHKTYVLLFSPRSALLFLEQVAATRLTGRLESVCAICLSDSVAAKARNASWRTVVTTVERNTPSMVERFCELAGL